MQETTMWRLILALLCLTVHNAVSLEILAIVSLPLRSHYMAFNPLFKELAKRGHSVTVINNFPDKSAHDNLKFVDLAVNLSEVKFRHLDEYEQYTFLYWDNFYRHVDSSPHVVVEDCETLIGNKDVLKLFETKKFDVIFVEQFISDCGLSLAGVKSDAPIIGITSHVLLPWSYDRLGIPFDVSADLFYFNKAGNKPNIIQKFESLVMKIIWNYFSSWRLQSCINGVFDKHLPGNSLDVQQVAYDRMKMMFAYQHFSYTGARLSSPQLLEIGGIHVGTPNRLPDNLDKFLNESTHGAIYVSFGSNLRSSTMSLGMFQNFLDAFKLINPIRVIWKFENDTIPAGYDNVLIGKWFPQLDVLCHRNLLGFVSHGGMLSTSEAVYCGVPMVSIPFFGDQFTNGAAIQDNGLGLYLDFNGVTPHILADKIREIFGKRFQDRAKEISTLFHDRPMSVMDSAIYWTEYVARYREAPPSMKGKYVPSYQAYLIDVYSIAIFCLVSFSYFIIQIFYIILNFIRYVKRRFGISNDESKILIKRNKEKEKNVMNNKLGPKEIDSKKCK